MELVYLYNFHQNKEINLSDEVFLSLREQVLIINSLNNRRIKDFFGEKISNVTVFAGKNQVGKSRTICQSLMDNYFPAHIEKCCVCMKKGDKLILFVSKTFSEIEIRNNSNLQYEKLEIPNDNNDVIAKSGLNRIFYSNDIHGIQPQSNFSIDISTHSYFTKIDSKAQGIDNSNIYFYFLREEIKTQIKFLQSDIAGKIDGFRESTHNVYCFYENLFDDSQKKQMKFYNGIFQTKYVSELYNLLLQNGSGVVNIKNFEPKIVVAIFFMIYANLQPKLHVEEFIRILKETSINDSLISKLSSSNEYLNFKPFVKFLLFVEQIFSKIETISLIPQSLRNGIDFTSLKFGIKKNDFLIFLNESDKVLKEKRGVFRFQWPLSSGERTLLSLYSRLFSKEEEIRRKNYLIVIDEGDSFFHPEWSRQYLKNIFSIIPKILKNAENIQFVITTHSPFILSDIPAKNIVLLEKVNDKMKQTKPTHETFGANIYDLLKDGFFMDDIIGSFAAQKISAIAQELSGILKADTTDNLPEYLSLQRKFIKSEVETTYEKKEIIELIGDKFIKDKLSEMYHIVMEGNNKEGLIKYYQEKLDELKQ